MVVVFRRQNKKGELIILIITVYEKRKLFENEKISVTETSPLDVV